MEELGSTCSSSRGRVKTSKNGRTGGNVTLDFFSAFPISSAGDFKYSSRIEFMLNHPKIRSKLEEWVDSTEETNKQLAKNPLESLGIGTPPVPPSKDLGFSIQMRELGNSLYTKKPPSSLLLSNALEAYNLSLLYAPSSSSSLSASAYELALANRSAVYLEMTRHEGADANKQRTLLTFALEDARKAVESPTYPKSQQPKLMQRIEKITSLLRDLEETNQGTNSTTSTAADEFTSNPNFENASSFVELKLSEAEKGRIVTCGNLKDLPKGTIVFKEKPFASVLLPQFISSHCSYCHVRLDYQHFFPCFSCTQVKFCSPSCVSSAWNSSHQFECGSLEFLHSVGIAHLALRVVLVAGKSRILSHRNSLVSPEDSSSDLNLFQVFLELSEEQKQDIAYSRVASLVDHLKDMTEAEDLFQYALSASLLTLWLVKKTKFFSEDEQQVKETHVKSNCDEEVVGIVGGAILKHICQLICNAHAITDLVYADDEFINVDRTNLKKGIMSTSTADSTQERIASAIYPSASMMNHSCDNNVVFGFVEGNKLIVRLSQNIPKGGEVFNCYGPHYRRMGVQDRQEILNDQYFFKCNCPTCVEELTGGMSFVETFEGFKCTLCSKGIVKESSGHCRSCKCQMDMDTFQEIVDSANYASKVMEDAEVLLERGKVKEALGMLQKCQEDRQHFLHPFHKDIGRGNDLIGKCHAMLGNFQKSVKHVRLSLNYVENRFGLDSFEYAREAKKLSQLLQKLDEMNEDNKVEPKYSSEIQLLTQHFTRILSF